MGDQSVVAVDNAVETSRGSKALNILHPLLAALSTEQLRQINVNIPEAATIMYGALPTIMSMRPDIVEHLPKFPIELLDTLETRTLAMDYAYAIRRMSAKDLEAVPQLVAQGSSKLTVLLGEANYLAMRGLIDSAPIEELRSASGHRPLASDLFALTYFLRTNWAAIEGKSQLTLKELGEADQIADHLVMALGARKQAASALGQSADLHQRAFTLFIVGYDRVRGALQYLQPKTHQQIMPYIHEARGAGKKVVSEEEIASEIRTATGVHRVVKDGAEESPAEAAEPDAAVGMPGSSPYTK